MPIAHIKRARTGTEVARLRHEAEMARRLAHPGVVVLLASRRTEDGGFDLAYELVTGVTLEEANLDAAQTRGVLLSVATTVHALHERGVAHRGLEAKHILIRTRDHRAVLCGLGNAIDLAEALDDARAQDITALLDLVETRGDAEARSLIPKLRTKHTKGRVSAEDLARALRALPPLAVLPDTKGDESPLDAEALAPVPSADEANPLRAARERAASDPEPPVPRRRRPALVTTGALVAVVIGLAAFTQFPAHSGGGPAGTTTRSCPATPARAGLVLDIDGDGCGDRVAISGTTISVNDQRFTVGQDGDELAIGRWSCDDQQTLALLRPSTGQLFTFRSWPAADQTTQPTLVTTVANARALRTDTTERCDRMAVITADRTVYVDPRTVTP